MRFKPEYKTARLYGAPLTIAGAGAVLSLAGCATVNNYLITLGIAIMCLSVPFLFRIAVNCYEYFIVERDTDTFPADGLSDMSPENFDFVVVRTVGRKKRVTEVRLPLDCLVGIVPCGKNSPDKKEMRIYKYSLSARSGSCLIFEDDSKKIGITVDICEKDEMMRVLTEMKNAAHRDV